MLKWNAAATSIGRGQLLLVGRAQMSSGKQQLFSFHVLLQSLLHLAQCACTARARNVQDSATTPFK